ncbi:Membrane protein involved in the export of O-antigen and teichoic acid [Granulicella rosea]|uniref:Membrane protein involved in the export of O-antigen and teichoic acid n=2 Tax=Granulicella rosea TaxID=474952 RepID=A0A239DD93_9BACT|nr:Membrane protein involved in the export of O-antigen and teichoic acid [Granulicella rosea]
MLGFLSGWVSKLGTSIIQFVQVPFFLHFWPETLFGEWLIVTSIPTYLSFSNIGFGNVAGNKMNMLAAQDDREGALRVFQSTWWLIVGLLAISGSVGAALIYLLPVSEKLRLHAISPADTRWILVYLGFSILLGQLETLLQSAYRAVGRYPYGSFVKSSISLVSFACMLIPVGLGYGPRATALVYAAANVAGTILLIVLVRRDIPWIRYGWSHASMDEVRSLVVPAIAFMGFPIGISLNLTGTLLAVGYALGPTAVVVFSTARTVSRVALQMVQMVNSTFEPEFSKSFAQGNAGLIRSLHRRACQSALLLAAVVVAGMIALGPWFLTHWTSGHVPPSRPLLSLLLLVVVLFSLWSTSSTVMTATNNHQKLAGVYLAATGVTVGITWLAAQHYGLYGAAASLLISELLMNLYVLPESLKLAHDTLPEFLRSLLTVPPALHPQALLRRLRRSKPALES